MCAPYSFGFKVFDTKAKKLIASGKADDPLMTELAGPNHPLIQFEKALNESVKDHGLEVYIHVTRMVN